MTTRTEEQIGEELLRIHRETHGSGASHARVHVLDDAVVVFLDNLELLPNEEFLIESGRDDVVVDMRRKYQSAVSASFSAAIERATGRRVTYFFSDTTVDERFSVELFRLG